MGDLYNKTHERSEYLTKAGFTVIEVWECDWLPTYKKISAESKAHVIEPLNPVGFILWW